MTGQIVPPTSPNNMSDTDAPVDAAAVLRAMSAADSPVLNSSAMSRPKTAARTSILSGATSARSMTATRAQIIEGAAMVFFQLGLRATPKQVAEATGVTLGAVFAEFPTIGDLVDAVVAEQNERMFATMMDAVGDSTGGEALVRSGAAVFSSITGDLVSLAGWRLGLERGSVSLEPEPYFYAWFQAFVSFYLQAAEAGEARPGLDPEALAYHSVAWVTGIAMTAGMMGQAENLPQLMLTMIELWIIAVANPPHHERLLGFARELFASRLASSQ